MLLLPAYDNSVTGLRLNVFFDTMKKGVAYSATPNIIEHVIMPLILLNKPLLDLLNHRGLKQSRWLL